MGFPEEFESGAQVNDGNVGGLNRQKHPVRSLAFPLVPTRNIRARAEEDVGMGHAIDSLPIETGGSALHRAKHERDWVAFDCSQSSGRPTSARSRLRAKPKAPEYMLYG